MSFASYFSTPIPGGTMGGGVGNVGMGASAVAAPAAAGGSWLGGVAGALGPIGTAVSIGSTLYGLVDAHNQRKKEEKARKKAEALQFTNAVSRRFGANRYSPGGSWY